MYLFKQTLQIIYLMQRIIKFAFHNVLVTLFILVIVALFYFKFTAVSAQVLDKALSDINTKSKDLVFVDSKEEAGLIYNSYCDVKDPDFVVIEDPYGVNNKVVDAVASSTGKDKNVILDQYEKDILISSTTDSI